MRFRAAELSSWQPYEVDGDVEGDCYPSAGCCVADDYADRVQWLHGAIGTGVVLAWEQEITNQTYVAWCLSGGFPFTLPVEVQQWFITCAFAGYFWPPLAHEISETLSFPATDLVHEVGFHWFHGNNRKFLDKKVGPELFIAGYQDAIRLQQDIDALRSVVVEPLAEQGFQLSTTAGAVAFDAVQPDPVLTGSISAWYYEGANTLLQAGMLARYLFFFRTAGFERMSWFCPLAGTIDVDEDGIIDNWVGDFIGTGLHNDLAREGEDKAEEPGFAALAAWRRPAWFTGRRVAWLLSLTEDAGTLVHNDRGLTMIRYRLSSRLAVSSSGMPTEGSGHRYLWIIWLDQYADSTCLHDAHLVGASPAPASSVGASEQLVWLGDAQDRGYTLLSLVPQVTESSDPTQTDANGYRQVTARDWTWDGWDGAILEQEEFAPALYPWAGEMTSVIRLRIRKADSADAPAPIAILTDADQFLTNDFDLEIYKPYVPDYRIEDPILPS